MIQLDKKEISLVKEKLSKLKPGDLPLPIFLEFFRLCVFATVEVVPIFRQGGAIKVLLTKRSPNDPTWPGLFHLPGSIIRKTDKTGSVNDALDRVIKDELKNIKIIQDPIFIEPTFRNLGRGKELTLLYLLLVEGKSRAGRYFDNNDLPDNIIKGQIKVIKSAIKYLEKNL